MGVAVQGILQGKEIELKKIGDKLYGAKAVAPSGAVKYADDLDVYDLLIRATGDNGEVGEASTKLYVKGANIFPLKFISATPDGQEIGYATEHSSVDVDLGDTNDFELRMSLDAWKKEKYWHGNRFYIPGTEWGGLLEEVSVSTKNNEITWMGYTWRGLLTQKVVEPPANQDHLTLNGELNTVIKQLVGDRFGSLFIVDDVETDVILSNWKVDRYVTLYDAIMKILDHYGYRLSIAYEQEEYPGTGAVHIKAVKAIDYSEDVEFSQDGKLYFTVQDYRRGINHLICAGTGQNEERIILHLYVQEDGSIGETKYYTGLAERTAVYDYSNADLDKLREDGTKKLKELMNYNSISVDVDNSDLELGDIVGGYEEITGTYVKQPIIGKILRMDGDHATVEYIVKGED